MFFFIFLYISYLYLLITFLDCLHIGQDIVDIFILFFLPPAGQDGTLQSFSTVHERFNKNLGHGQFNSNAV